MSAGTTFQVISWDEDTVFELDDGARITRARVKQTYSGEIEGTAVVEYVMYHRADGTAIFTGLERIAGSIQGKQGSVVLSHAGTYEGGFAQSHWQIVAHSGTGELAAATGAGSFRAGIDMKATVLPMIIV